MSLNCNWENKKWLYAYYSIALMQVKQKDCEQPTENPGNEDSGEYNVVSLLSPDADRFETLVNPGYVLFNGSFI